MKDLIFDADFEICSRPLWKNEHAKCPKNNYTPCNLAWPVLVKRGAFFNLFCDLIWEYLGFFLLCGSAHSFNEFSKGKKVLIFPWFF